MPFRSIQTVSCIYLTEINPRALFHNLFFMRLMINISSGDIGFKKLKM